MSCICKEISNLKISDNIDSTVLKTDRICNGNIQVKEKQNGCKRIGIIGGGWYGCHIGLSLKRKYPRSEIFIFEKNEKLMSEISGNYGIRLHAGPHYPRSPETRKVCRTGFLEFMNCYSDLVNEHEYSIYGLGNNDANGDPSKVGAQHFASVCSEFEFSQEIDPGQWKFENLIYAADIKEPSIAVGQRLRNYFSRNLVNSDVKIFYSAGVTSVRKTDTGEILVTTANGDSTILLDSVINATGFTSLLPSPLTDLPLGMEIVFQICAALVYEYSRKPENVSSKPFSFIVMDGWFPCIMPYDDRRSKDEEINKYIVTHGKWTILGSYTSYEEANKLMKEIENENVEQEVKLKCEKYLSLFWPAFSEEFQYRSWKTAILPKIKSQKEFRGAVTFQDTRNDLIHIIPGKINNIFDAEREVLSLIDIDSTNNQVIVNDGNWRYIKEGVLVSASQEITEKPFGDRHTCGLQTYNDILKCSRFQR